MENFNKDDVLFFISLSNIENSRYVFRFSVRSNKAIKPGFDELF